jgi:DinB superfamily
MQIAPDTKDWTWVLERPCPECGFDSTNVTGRDVPLKLRENAVTWVGLLSGDRDVRARPDAGRWSALEYACHVRDVFRIFEHRLTLMVSKDDPTFPNWDQDATAVAERYDTQDPRVVATELQSAAARLAESIDGLSADAWDRTGTRSDGARFTVATLTRYLIHDPVHHLYDVGG